MIVSPSTALSGGDVDGAVAALALHVHHAPRARVRRRGGEERSVTGGATPSRGATTGAGSSVAHPVRTVAISW